MKLATRPGRLAAWIAIFAILLAALAPSVARAVSSSQKAMPWTEICTLAGAQAAHDLAPASGSGQHQGGVLKHCPFCLGNAGHFVLPNASPGCLPTAEAGSETFPPDFTSPSPRFIRAAAQPRAPPAVS